jgi:hypothetical protein
MVFALVEEFVEKANDSVEIDGLGWSKGVILVFKECLVETTGLDIVKGMANLDEEVVAVTLLHQARPKILISHGLSKKEQSAAGMVHQVLLVPQNVSH